jgi:hypothetical protein
LENVPPLVGSQWLRPRTGALRLGLSQPATVGNFGIRGKNDFTRRVKHGRTGRIHAGVLEHFQLLRSAGFPAYGFRRLSSRLFREDETRDKNVPQTRRQECLRYIKVGTALIVNCGYGKQPRQIAGMGIGWNIVSRRHLGILIVDHISVRPPMGLGMSIGIRQHTGIAMQNCRTRAFPQII